MLKKLLPWLLPLWGIVLISFFYGYYSKANHIFPHRLIAKAEEAFVEYRDKLEGKLPVYYVHDEGRTLATTYRPEEMAPGLTLILGVGTNESLFAKLVDAQGKVAHQWDLDWFRIWPDATHLPAKLVPKTRPGTNVHGAVLSPNGDLSFNFEDLGLVQVDVCGRTKWRLPRGTNHSVFEDEEGNFWSHERPERHAPVENLPNFKPPFHDIVILKISHDGKVLKEIPFFEVLKKNGYQGLLYLRAPDHISTAVGGDNFHVNDIEVFPSTIKSDFVSPGDVMVSARNINAIVIFDPESLVVKQVVVGPFIRQHDPDFLDGSTITVFDNNPLGLEANLASSHIVEYSFKTGSASTRFEGNPQHPFFSERMGKHQHLPTGGMLLTEATNGRVIEVNANDDIIWEYNNLASPGLIGIVDSADRIPPDILSPEKLATLVAACGS